MHTNWEVGQTIDGLYEIFGSSSGGMGAVYFVNHLKWKIPLAVKTPLLTLINSPSAYRRYIKEAETWINIGMHPHIVSCFYVRDLDGIPRIFIEYVSGGTLKDLIDNKQLGDINYLLDLAIQFSMAMEYVHELGIIHRDIKPANCMITGDGELKVTDFGIAKLGDDVPDTDDKPHFATSYEGLTMTGTGFGTPEYMAPEQFLDAKNIGKEADIYAFGVMLYEMVCGSRPFVMPAGMNAQARDYFYRNAHFNETPRPPAEINRHIPLSLNRLILKCLEKDVSKRLQSFAQISAMLSDCCKEVGTSNHRIKPDTLKLKADSLNNKAISYLDLGKSDEAFYCWQQALAEDPQHFEGTFNYGYCQWQQGALYRDVLRSQMENLKSKHEENYAFWRILAWLYYEVGDIDALEKLQNSSHRVTTPEFIELYNELNTPNCRWLRIYKATNFRNAKTVSFSADGRYLFSVSYAVGLRQWGTTSGKEFTHFEIPKGYVNSFIFSPDGKYALAGCREGLIILLDVITGKEIRSFEWSGEHVDINDFQIDPERIDEDFYNRIVTRKIRITNIVHSLGFSLGSTSIIASGSTSYTCVLKCDQNCTINLNDHPDYNAIIQWDTNTGREVQRLKACGKINSVAFSPDGKYILSGSSQSNNSGENTLKLWDVITGKDLRRFDGYNESINSVAFSSDGKLAISAGTLRVWELATGKVLSLFEDYHDPIALSPDGRFILAGSNKNGYENTITLLDAMTGDEVSRFEGHSVTVYAVAFSPGGRYILIGGWGGIKLQSWGRPLKKASDVGLYPVLCRIRPTLDMLTESKEALSHLTVANTLIGKGSYKEAYQYLRTIQRISGYEKNEEVLDQINLCGIKGNGVRKNFKIAWAIASFSGHSAYVTTIAFSPDGKHIISGGADNQINQIEDSIENCNIRLWEISSCKEMRYRNVSEGVVDYVKFSHCGKYALTGISAPSDESYDETIHDASRCIIIVWEVLTGIEIRRFEVYGREICNFKFSSDAKFVLSWGSDENNIWLWDIETGNEIRHFEEYTGRVTTLASSPDGRFILAGDVDKKVIILWEVSTGRKLKQFAIYGTFLAGSFSTNGKYVLFSGEESRSIRLWEIATGREVRQFEGHNGNQIRSAIFSPDGNYVLTREVNYIDQNMEEKLSLWHAATGRKFHLYNSAARITAFSHDNRYLAFSNRDNSITLLELDWEWEFPEG